MMTHLEVREPKHSEPLAPQDLVTDHVMLGLLLVGLMVLAVNLHD